MALVNNLWLGTVKIIYKQLTKNKNLFTYTLTSCKSRNFITQEFVPDCRASGTERRMEMNVLKQNESGFVVIGTGSEINFSAQGDVVLIRTDGTATYLGHYNELKLAKKVTLAMYNALNMGNVKFEMPTEEEAQKSSGERISDRADSIDICDLELSVRSYNCLKRDGIDTVGDLIRRVNETGLVGIRNLGAESRREVLTKLERKKKQLDL